LTAGSRPGTPRSRLLVFTMDDGPYDLSLDCGKGSIALRSAPMGQPTKFAAKSGFRCMPNGTITRRFETKECMDCYNEYWGGYILLLFQVF
jgi:hypothetical protein